MKPGANNSFTASGDSESSLGLESNAQIKWVPAWPEKTEYFRHVGLLAQRVKTVKAADIEGNVERAAERVQVCHVAHEELEPHVVPGDALLRFGNRDGREVDPGRTGRGVGRSSATRRVELVAD